MKRRDFLKLASATPVIAGIIWTKNKFHSASPSPIWKKTEISRKLQERGLEIIDFKEDGDETWLSIAGYSRIYKQRFICNLYISQALMDSANFDVANIIEYLVANATEDGPAPKRYYGIGNTPSADREDGLLVLKDRGPQ